MSWRVVASFAALAVFLICAGMRAPAVWADQPPDIGPIVVTAPDGRTASIDTDSTETHAKSAFPSGSIVFKHDGKSYVIRDQASVDAAQKLIQPIEEAAAAEGEFGEQQAELGKKMADLANIKVDIDTKALEESMREMEKHLSSPEMQKAVKDMEQAQKRLAEVQSKLGDDFSKRMTEQMNRLAAEQARLGELQSRLGQRQAEQSKGLQEELEKLVKKAQEQGLAKPIE